MNLSAIFSKTGKGVQEASGKTSHLSRADRAVLSAIDGKTALAEVQKKFEKLPGSKFEALIQQLDKDGFIREVSTGTQAPAPRVTAPAAKAPPPPKADDGDEALDFTQALTLPPKAPAAPVAPKAPQQDLAAASRADAERKAKERDALDYRGRQETEAKAKAEAEAKARAASAEAKARAAAEEKARAEAQARAAAEAKAKAEADARALAEADAKVKAAREAAIRMATEAKAKAEAEARVKTESADRERQAAEDRARREAEDKARLEADLNAKLDAERKAREDAERRAAEASERARKELEEKAKREADELRQRLEAEMKAKLEEERRARDEEDRKRREEEDRRRKEEDERRAKAEAERRAKEEAERKQREEEDRKRREEEDRRRKEEDERRAKAEAERRAKEEAERKAEAERRAKEEAERKAKEEAERKAKEAAERKAKEEAERRAKEEAERKAREDADRKRREEEDRRRREEDERRAKEDAERKAREAEERRKREDEERKRRAEDEERRARDERERKAREEAEAKARATTSASLPAIEPAAPTPRPPAAAADGGIGDSLLADLDSFTQREDEERKAKEEAERQAKEAAARQAKEAAERQAKEEADKKRREEEERHRKEEEERRAREDEERRAREEEAQRKAEEAERKRNAKEALAAKQTEERRARAAAARGGKDGDDIGVSDDDLDMDEVKSDHKVLAARAAKVAQEQPAVTVAAARPRKLGKPVAIALFAILIAGVGLLHVVPMSTADYEKAASEAFGAPVRIGSARLSVITGVEVKFEGVSIGEAVKIRQLRGFPEIGSLFGARKSFSRIELEGLAISQSQVADAVLGKVAGENFRVGRVTVKQLTLEGPLKLPPLEVDAVVAGDGSVQSLKLSGADKLVVQLSPKGSDIGFEISAGSLALPFVPALTLNEFGMKGTATRGGVTSSEFDGRAFDGVISGTARIRWGASWTVEGEVRARAVKVAVFAPALASEGKVEGRAAYSMSGSAPGSLHQGARMQGEFKIEQGVLGSFDLTRALQTGGAQATGRTVFSELTGQGVYDKGAVQLRNVAIAAGAMNAGASLDIDPNGGLSGRIAAEVKTPNQTLRATLNVSGKVQDPVIRK